MAIIDEWVDHILSVEFENLNSDDVGWAKLRILDVIGCMAAGVKASGNKELLSIATSLGLGNCSVFFSEVKLPLLYATMVNSIMARSLDYGPVDPEFEDRFFPGHISETTIPTALNVAEYVSCSGREMIVALLLGEDIVCRLLAASDYNPQKFGWNNVSVANAFAVVALYSRLLHLDGKKIRNAFGLLLDLISGTFQSTQERCTAFKLCQGVAAKNGIFAVELARIGWTGPKDPLFSRYGYFNMFAPCVSREPLLKNLGLKYYTDRTIKPYPSCRLTHAAIDCALLIRDELLNPAEIEEVTLYIAATDTASSIAEPYVVGDFPEANAIFSYQYTVATALLKGRFKPEDHENLSLRDPGIISLANKVHVVHSEDLKSIHGAILKVKCKSGKEIFRKVEVARGDRRQNPLSLDEIRNKFFENMQYGERGNVAAEIFECVNELERLEEITPLINLLK